MEIIKFSLNKQKISLIDCPVIASNSKDYLYASFELESEDWVKPIIAIFISEEKVPFSVTLDDDNMCKVPWEVLQYGNKVEVSAVCGDLHTATSVTFTFENSGYRNGNEPLEPTPTIWSELSKKIDSKQDKLIAGSITTENIASKAVTMEKLADDVTNQLSEIKNEIVDIDSAVFTPNVNIFDKNNITVGKAPNTNIGKTITDMVSNDNKFVSNQIFKIKKGDTIYCNVGWGLFAIYDSNGKYIGKINNAELLNKITFDGATYMLYSSKNITGYVDKFMLSINKELPKEYIPYGKTSKIKENFDAIKNINDELHPEDTSIIILDFDQRIEENDNRIAIMESYGWKPSFVGGVTTDITKQLLAKGWDLSTYWNSTNVPTNEQLSGASESDLEACKLYVKTGLESQEVNGFYNPVSWSCRQNKYGETLGKALQYYGYRICRGGGNNGFDQNINDKFTRTNATGIYTNNLSVVKSAIDNAVMNKQAINIFTHFVVDISDEDRGYDCLKSVYIELMEYIKDLEDNGKVIVTNYRKFYEMKYPDLAYENDYSREIKRMNFIESKIS